MMTVHDKRCATQCGSFRRQAHGQPGPVDCEHRSAKILQSILRPSIPFIVLVPAQVRCLLCDASVQGLVNMIPTCSGMYAGAIEATLFECVSSLHMMSAAASTRHCRACHL